jgi:hypothetical protein
MTRLTIQAALRSILFNTFTVPYCWMPLMHLAERHQFVAALMLPEFYRGVIVHHFRKGYREAGRLQAGDVRAQSEGT